MDKIEPMDWEDIIMNVGNPVYDKNEKRWRIIKSYLRDNEGFFVGFTDSKYWEKFQSKKFYLREV